MADFDFLMEGMGRGANLALQIYEEEQRVKRDRAFIMERDRQQRIHENQMLTSEYGFRETEQLAERMWGERQEALRWERGVAREDVLLGRGIEREDVLWERGAPMRDLQMEAYEEDIATAGQRRRLQPFDTARGLITAGATPSYGAPFQVPDVPFSLEFQKPQEVSPYQDPEFIRAYTSQLSQARLIFTELLRQRNITIDQMAELRIKNPEVFQAQIKRFPILGHLPLIGRIFQGSEEAAWDYFLPDATGQSQAERDISDAKMLENQLLRMGTGALFPGGPMAAPRDTTGYGGPMEIPGGAAGFGGYPMPTIPGLMPPVTSDADLAEGIKKLNVPSKQAGDVIRTAGDVVERVGGELKGAMRNIGFFRGQMAPTSIGMRQTPFSILSRSRWPRETEEMIEQRIKDSIIAGEPITREVAIYQIWSVGESLGTGRGRYFFGKPVGPWK